MHVNFAHSKKTIKHTFSGPSLNFLGKNHKTRTNNLHHHKAGSVAVILSLRVGANIYKKWCIKFYNAVTGECTLYLSRPHRHLLSRTKLSQTVKTIGIFLCWATTRPPSPRHLSAIFIFPCTLPRSKILGPKNTFLETNASS